MLGTALNKVLINTLEKLLENALGSILDTVVHTMLHTLLGNARVNEIDYGFDTAFGIVLESACNEL